MDRFRIAGVAAGMALVSVLVLQVSSAAFTSSTTNADNDWTAGTVTLTGADSGGVMFTASNMAPGDTLYGCVEVSYDGSLTLSNPVNLHATVTETNDGTGDGGDGLADDLQVTVALGDATTSCPTPASSTTAYSGTLQDFPATAAATTWTPSGTDLTRPFRFTVELPTTAASNAQGDGASADFTWSVTT